MNIQPETTFHQPSLEYDTLRLLFTAHKLATGQYQYHNWLVSPILPKHSPSNLITFPSLPYTDIPHFWTNCINHINATTPPTAPDQIVTSLTSLLSPTWSPDNYHNYQPLQDTWDNIKDQFWSAFFCILPTYQSRLKHINIYPTLYGTTKSFSLIDRKTTTLHIYLRVDQDISSLIDGILSGTIREKLQHDQHLTWTETEAVKDTFLLTTPLRDFAPNYQSTLHAIRSSENKKRTSDSLNYLRHLGLDSADKWNIQDNTIQYHSQTLTNLTKQDRLILTTLINTPNHALTQHELANALYPNPDKFSLWGLAKAIERLRKKLTQNNLPPHLIQVNRGQGYSLFSAPTITKPNDLVF